jgi:hypothetical protein
MEFSSVSTLVSDGIVIARIVTLVSDGIVIARIVTLVSDGIVIARIVIYYFFVNAGMNCVIKECSILIKDC